MEHVPRGKGEEYLNSEKYEIRDWDLERVDSLRPLITRLNAARYAHPALQSDWRLRFFATDNEQLICFAKSTPDFSDVVLVVVNLDPRYTQAGWVTLELSALGLTDGASFGVRDLLTDVQYQWQGTRNFVQLDPLTMPAHVFHLIAPAGGRRLLERASK